VVLRQCNPSWESFSFSFSEFISLTGVSTAWFVTYPGNFDAHEAAPAWPTGGTPFLEGLDIPLTDVKKYAAIRDGCAVLSCHVRSKIRILWQLVYDGLFWLYLTLSTPLHLAFKQGPSANIMQVNNGNCEE
jgi:hypothetical protein